MYIEKLKSVRQKFRTFRNDKNGAMAFTWGLSIMGIIAAVGSSFDYSQLSNAKSKSQSIADAVALSAAVFVKENDRLPENSQEGYLQGHTYSASDIGYDYNENIMDIEISIQYDQANREAIVNVTGTTSPAFMKIFGYDSLEFQSQSVAGFEIEKTLNPASIALILDNSGSMNWHDTLSPDNSGPPPTGSTQRITGLKNSVTFFMNELEEVIADNTEVGDRILRTGMIPYNSRIIGNRQVAMRWGTIPNNNIQVMSPGGGTNPLRAMRRARDWLRNENQHHENENGSTTPIKYAIFMTDGQNASTRIDNQVLNVCNQMKNQGVEVFTIGYAMDPGYYYYYYSSRNGHRYLNISQRTSNRVYNFLGSCASSPDHFITAVGEDSLAAAFEKIGESVTEGVLRIKS